MLQDLAKASLVRQQVCLTVYLKVIPGEIFGEKTCQVALVGAWVWCLTWAAVYAQPLCLCFTSFTPCTALWPQSWNSVLWPSHAAMLHGKTRHLLNAYFLRLLSSSFVPLSPPVVTFTPCCHRHRYSFLLSVSHVPSDARYPLTLPLVPSNHPQAIG